MFAALRQTSRSVAVLRSPRVAGATLMRRHPLAFAQARTIVTKRYTDDHEAVSFDDQTKIGTVMITDYAQKSLGDVVFVELPSEGAVVEKGDVIGAVESVKAASDIYSPVTGTVIAINSELDGSPSLLNKSPEEKGWLCKIEVKDPAEVEVLMTQEEYKAHCES